jgi:FixJ family two-component response regulator
VNFEHQVVFVLDDDPGVREALTGLLRSVGLRGVAFATAAEFLKAKAPEPPACLILDLQLPDRNGLELQQLLAEENGPPIVFISGHANIPSSVRAMKAGAVEFLTKPFSDEELLEAIASAIAQDRKTREGRLCPPVAAGTRGATAGGRRSHQPRECGQSWHCGDHATGPSGSDHAQVGGAVGS